MPEVPYELRQRLACKICGNCPDAEGDLEHGRGCYTQDANGGGSEWFDLAEEFPEFFQPKAVSMSRELTSHKINGCNDVLKVVAMDVPGSGGANHSYMIYADESKVTLGNGVTVSAGIEFQNGPILEAGVNGLTNESLLAIVIDRLQGFQKGQFACRENAIALTKLEEAMHWLKHRTEQRLARGVEGTHQK